MNNFKALQDILLTPKKVVIFPHIKPDADALGSCLALSSYLQKSGHTTTVISPTDYPSFLFWMKGNDDVLIYTHKDQREKAEEKLEEADIYFCLDFSALSRIDGLGHLLSTKVGQKPIVLIDHHRGKEDFADFELWDINAAATAQLIYEFIEMDNGLEKIDEDIAKCIYAGIMTDTGSFKFPSTSSRTLRIAANLKEVGIDTSLIHNLVYDNNTESRLRFLGYALQENLTFIPELKAGYFCISMEVRDRFNIQTGDTEGLVNYALSVAGIQVAALFKESDDSEGIKLSLRSVGDVSVADMASKYFNGGGHKNAAGGRLPHSTLEEAVDIFKKALQEIQQTVSE
ncbi:bifunctional oligoribonuclease/PAP phosphatase NrnA [Algivirga pacifica]|uniref:Bifunctional oligoribonuclease/PAP phosphatase NrnA n=1 Tax=Algivirga pacifica TaxID=1162670 RepID=A0ABP9DHS6_9BACT